MINRLSFCLFVLLFCLFGSFFVGFGSGSADYLASNYLSESDWYGLYNCVPNSGGGFAYSFQSTESGYLTQVKFYLSSSGSPDFDMSCIVVPSESGLLDGHAEVDSPVAVSTNKIDSSSVTVHPTKGWVTFTFNQTFHIDENDVYFIVLLVYSADWVYGVDNTHMIRVWHGNGAIGYTRIGVSTWHWETGSSNDLSHQVYLNVDPASTPTPTPSPSPTPAGTPTATPYYVSPSPIPIESNGNFTVYMIILIIFAVIAVFVGVVTLVNKSQNKGVGILLGFVAVVVFVVVLFGSNLFAVSTVVYPVSSEGGGLYPHYVVPSPSPTPLPTYDPLGYNQSGGTILKSVVNYGYQFNDNEVAFVADHFDLVVMNYEIADNAHDLHELHDDIIVIGYRDLLMARESWAVPDWSVLQSHPDWFMREGDGDYIYTPYWGCYIMNPFNAEYRDHIISWVNNRTASGDYDGVLFDDVWYYPEWYTGGLNGTIPQGWLDNWRNYMVTALDDFTANINGLVIINCDEFWSDTFISHCDGQMMEFYVHNLVSSDQWNSYRYNDVELAHKSALDKIVIAFTDSIWLNNAYDDVVVETAYNEFVEHCSDFSVSYFGAGRFTDGNGNMCWWDIMDTPLP